MASSELAACKPIGKPSPPGHELFASLVSECRAELERQRAEMRITGFGGQSSQASLRRSRADKVRELEVLITAAERMAGVTGRKEMFQATYEVLANLLGTERFAVFERLDCRLRRVAFSGNAAEIPVVMAYANMKLPPSEEATPQLRAPLMFGEVVVGLLVIYGFLPQKHETWTGDSALLHLVQRIVGAGLVAFPPADEVNRGT